MTASPDQPERRTLDNLLRDRRAAEALAAITAPAAVVLELDCSGVTQVDTYGGAVIRTAVEAHLNRDPRHRVTVIEPAASDCWPLLSDLLGGTMPSGCSWAGTRSPATRGRDVLIPAMTIDDPEGVALILDYVAVVAPALGHGVRAGQLLQEAAAVFLDNVWQHAPDRPIQPVVCAAFDPTGRNLQLVCVNLDGPQTGPPRTQAQLRLAIDDARTEFRSIATLAERSRGELVFTVRLLTGSGRARHRTGEDWRFASGVFVPGFVAGIEVHS